MAVKELKLTNNTVHFSPPNVKSVFQPCNTGNIQAFKAHYCCQFIQCGFQRYDNNTPWTSKQVYNLNILEAMQMSQNA